MLPPRKLNTIKFAHEFFDDARVQIWAVVKLNWSWYCFTSDINLYSPAHW